MTDPAAESVAPPTAPAPIACPRCGAVVAGDQSWCLECGLAARTRLAPTPGWRTPLIVAGAIGLAAIVALIVAFLVVTGDNAPLPTTAAPAAAPAVTAAPPATTADPATTVPTTPGTTPTLPVVTTTPPTTPAVPPEPTATAP